MSCKITYMKPNEPRPPPNPVLVVIGWGAAQETGTGAIVGGDDPYLGPQPLTQIILHGLLFFPFSPISTPVHILKCEVC